MIFFVILGRVGFKAMENTLFQYTKMVTFLTSIANLQSILILCKGCAKNLDNRFVNIFCGRHDLKFVDDCCLLNDKVVESLDFQRGNRKFLQVIYARSMKLFWKTHV
uniref:(northern house mosquito) hypothetical protein n=1 Tax=Culex pipiens TaxID=7175 RepID=A0A8D8KFP3_CULPI